MRTMLLGTMMALAVAAAAWAGEPELKTDEEKTIYALGLAMSQNLAAFNLSEK